MPRKIPLSFSGTESSAVSAQSGEGLVLCAGGLCAYVEGVRIRPWPTSSSSIGWRGACGLSGQGFEVCAELLGKLGAGIPHKEG